MRRFSSHLWLYLCFTAFLLLNILVWTHSRPLQPTWGNVPPAISHRNAVNVSLGDTQMGYRVIGLMLQNFGNSGGVSKSLKEYDYNHVADWLFLATSLDSISNFVPALGAFYFGATSKGEDLTPIINYLVVVGHQPQKQKWRWLAHAVYLARYVQNDLGLALTLAQQLADLPRDDLPFWARQMPIFVMTAKGDKEAAYDIIMETLKSGVDDLQPTEIRMLRDYTCDRVLTPDQAAINPLCKDTE